MYFCFVFSFFWTLFSQVKSGRERLRESLCSLQRIRNRDRFSIHPEGFSVLRERSLYSSGVREMCWRRGKARRVSSREKNKKRGLELSLSLLSLSAPLSHSLNLCVSKFCSEEGSLAACVEKYVQTTLVH